jgi:hypothetical protein
MNVAESAVAESSDSTWGALYNGVLNIADGTALFQWKKDFPAPEGPG